MQQLGHGAKRMAKKDVRPRLRGTREQHRATALHGVESPRAH